jgi:hypothetical protein
LELTWKSLPELGEVFPDLRQLGAHSALVHFKDSVERVWRENGTTYIVRPRIEPSNGIDTLRTLSYEVISD